MNGQIVVDGVLTGAMVGLGAVGLTMVYSILRFANFTHGDYVSAGAYIALVVADALAVRLGAWGQSLGALTFGLPLIVALVVAMALTGLLALAIDWLLFRRLRRHGSEVVLVIASFGASLALRSAIEFIFGERPFLLHPRHCDGHPAAIRHARQRRPVAAAGHRAGADGRAASADDAHAAGAGDARHQREPGAGPGQRHRRGGGGAADLGDRRRAGGGGRGVPRPHRAVAPVHGFDLLLPLFAAAILAASAACRGRCWAGW